MAVLNPKNNPFFDLKIRFWSWLYSSGVLGFIVIFFIVLSPKPSNFIITSNFVSTSLSVEKN